MRALYPTLVAACLVLATTAVAQDGPMRKAGSFAAEATGVVNAKVAGDASVSQPAKGARTLHLYLNSDQMSALATMISVEAALPSAGDKAAKLAVAPPPGDGARPTKWTARVQWESLTTRMRRTAYATGTIEIDGKDPMAGTFQLSASDGGETLALSGSFAKAPVVPD